MKNNILDIFVTIYTSNLSNLTPTNSLNFVSCLNNNYSIFKILQKHQCHFLNLTHHLLKKLNFQLHAFILQNPH